MKLRFFGIWCLPLLAALLLDRWLKSLALAGRTVEWPIGRFVLVENDAAVFSWPVPNTGAIVLMIAALAGLIWYGWRAWRRGNQTGFIGALCMIVGAGSNLYDRIVHGFVTDWAYLGPWWPVFNLADVMITVGLGLVVFQSSRKKTQVTV